MAWKKNKNISIRGENVGNCITCLLKVTTIELVLYPNLCNCISTVHAVLVLVLLNSSIFTRSVALVVNILELHYKKDAGNDVKLMLFNVKT